MPSRLVPAPAELVLAQWTGITARVAWTLLRLGVKPRPDVFHEARLDAVLRLSADPDPALIEDHAELYTEAWVARIRGRSGPRWTEDWALPVTPDNVPVRQDDPDLLVLRRHYGDHRRLVDLVRAHGITLDTLEAAQNRLRFAAMAALRDPGAPLGRVEQLLRRLAAWAPGPCPAVEELGAPRHRAHVADCPRCDRAMRLIQREVVPIEEFTAPRELPAPVVDVAVLQLHPRRAVDRDAFVDAFAVAAPVGSDAVAVSAHDSDQLSSAIADALTTCSIGASQIRAIRRRGPGVLSPRGVAGPLLDDGIPELDRVAWGDLTGTPRDDRARGVRSLALGVLAVSAIAMVPVGLRIAVPPELDPTAPQIAMVEQEGQVRATLDVAEDAWVSAFALRDGRLHVVREASSASDKATWATGDGRYELVTDGGLLVAIHDGPLTDLPAALADADQSDTPLPTLAERLTRQATVRWSQSDVR
ncbi:MAG: hypothetical protein AAF211_07015 [Myxococcota bacterium]